MKKIKMRNEKMICKVCSLCCDKIGELNKIGVTKVYCCECYNKYFDKRFIKPLWCEVCRKE